MAIRRVITGHDDNNKAVVVEDGVASNVKTPIPGVESTLVWATDTNPANITDDEDMGARVLGTPPPLNGTRFCIHEIQPGASGGPPPQRVLHRTDTIDYVIVIQGSLLMMLDEEDVELGQGDVVIMRGTNHGWRNVGDGVCKVAFVLIDGEKLQIPGAPAKTS